MKAWFIKFWDFHGERLSFTFLALAMCSILWQITDLQEQVKGPLFMILGIFINKIRGPESSNTQIK